MSTLINARERIWHRISRNHPPYQILTPFLRVCRLILYPKATLLWILQQDCGYDPLRHAWTINGVEFTDGFFRAFTKNTPSDRCFTVYIEDSIPGIKRPMVSTHWFRFVREVDGAAGNYAQEIVELTERK